MEKMHILMLGFKWLLGFKKFLCQVGPVQLHWLRKFSRCFPKPRSKQSVHHYVNVDFYEK